MMFALLYQSDAVRGLTITELDALINTSVRNNAANDITGLLVYKDLQFMQLLEGSKQAIDKLYAVLQKDTRHTNIKLLFQGEIAKRNVTTWSCGFLNADADELDYEYVDFIYNIATNNFQDDSKVIQELFLKFTIKS